MDIDWPAFLPVAAGISVIPGANQLLGFRNAYRYGVAPALVGVLGAAGRLRHHGHPGQPGASRAVAAVSPQRRSPALGLLLIGFAYVCMEAVCATVYVAVGSRLPAMDITASRDRVISRATGTCLLGLAVYLALPLS